MAPGGGGQGVPGGGGGGGETLALAACVVGRPRAGRPAVTLSKVAMCDPVLGRPAMCDPVFWWPAKGDPALPFASDRGPGNLETFTKHRNTLQPSYEGRSTASKPVRLRDAKARTGQQGEQQAAGDPDLKGV